MMMILINFLLLIKKIEQLFLFTDNIKMSIDKFFIHLIEFMLNLKLLMKFYLQTKEFLWKILMKIFLLIIGLLKLLILKINLS